MCSNRPQFCKGLHSYDLMYETTFRNNKVHIPSSEMQRVTFLLSGIEMCPNLEMTEGQYCGLDVFVFCGRVE